MDVRRKLPISVEDEEKTTNTADNVHFDPERLLSAKNHVKYCSETAENKQGVPAIPNESPPFKSDRHVEVDNLGKNNEDLKLSTVLKYESDNEKEPLHNVDQQLAIWIEKEDSITVRKGNNIE